MNKLITGFLVLFLVYQMMAQSAGPEENNSRPDEVDIPMLPAPVKVDGNVEASEWSHIKPLHMVSHMPVYSPTPNADTQLKIAYDKKYLYVSAICKQDPSTIQGPNFERDNLGMTMDHIALVLDTYNDNENAVAFVVTPTGSRSDLAIFNDGQGPAPVDVSWNSYWEASVKRYDQGWMMEARIPFSSLRFQTKNNKVTMGLIAYRFIASSAQMDIYPSIPPKWGFWSFFKVSKAQDVVFENIENKRPWFTSPYALGKTGYHHVESTTSSAPEKVDDTGFTAGLDVQHALTDNLNLDLTFNTDFAQVEADNQVVNLSRFNLFFPEKRRFFLERSSVMDFSFEDNNRLFYSRRIGINDGRIIPLWGGARLVGRINNFDLGFMTMQSQADADIPSENFGVFRLRKRVSSNNSYIGTILTTRTDWMGNLNLTYGADGIINLFGDDYLKVNLAASYDGTDSTSEGSLKDHKRIYALWERRSQIGFNYALSYSQVDPNFNPGIGFEARNNFKSVGNRLSYGKFASDSSFVLSTTFSINSAVFFSGNSNNLESYLIAPTFNLTWKKRSEINLTYQYFYDKVPEAFNLSDDIVIDPDEYVNSNITLNYQTPQAKFLNAMFSSTVGSFYGGERISASVTPNYVISKYLTLGGFYQYNHVSFSGLPDYVAHVGRFKVATSLNVHWGINTFIQVNSLNNTRLLNFRVRYNQRDGNDLYLVYNETLNSDGKDNPNLPFSDYRSIIVKYVYTFKLGQ